MNNLRDLRASLKLSVKDLAERTGIPVPTIKYLERSHSNPTLRLAYRVAAVLGLTVMDIWPDPNEVAEEVITVRRINLSAREIAQ
jgi:transcriptional regulator with XRE-family HTH domain